MRTIFMGAALLLSILFPLTAEADATLQINKAWSRATPPGAQAGVVYMTIENTGAEADTLQSVSTPLSANAMIHESVMKNGVMTMSHMMALPIPAKGSVLLAPGGLHVMLMGLTAAPESRHDPATDPELRESRYRDPRRADPGTGENPGIKI